MTAPVECRYYGRDFTTAEMALLRSLIVGPPALNRHALSKEFCRRIGWYKVDGGIKDMMTCAVTMARRWAAVARGWNRGCTQHALTETTTNAGDLRCTRTIAAVTTNGVPVAFSLAQE